MIDTLGLSRTGTNLLFASKVNAVLLAEVNDEKKGEIYLSIYSPTGRNFRKSVFVDNIKTANTVLRSIVRYYVNEIKEKITNGY